MPGDTQLPRYQVFLQEKDGEPYQDAGSVHAADAEMALQNARDVFVRRPECHSLWVVPAGAIFSRTAQELELEEQAGLKPESQPAAGEPESQLERYYVFCKAKSAGTQTLVGEGQAHSARAALEQYRQTQPARRPPFAWWVLPASRVVASQPEDAASMFAPAFTKPFRQATDFHTLTAMRTIKAGRFKPKEK
jgi:ring-1,2-phenylacetyl-CoA epoxidase subunit PaaB